MPGEMKPCPYCGFEFVSVSHICGGSYSVDCENCDMVGPAMSSEEEAIEAWNELPRREDYQQLKKDFDTAARSAAEESEKAARLKREADWLADITKRLLAQGRSRRDRSRG